MGKYSLMVVGGLVFTFGYITSNLNRVSEYFVDDLVDYYERAEARLAAGSVVHMSLAALCDSSTWRHGYSNVSFGAGSGWATIEDSTTDTTLSEGDVRLTAGGSSGSFSDTVVVLVSLSPPAIPPGVHGGATANTTVDTKGNMYIDGRDHDLNGNLIIGGQGSMGISTTQSYSQGGNSKAGGTVGGVDYAPSKPASSAIVEENATYTFPATPDDALGYAAGTLKAMAQSGTNGGQYVTNPSNLTFPLSGVTYVELASGSTWQSINLGASSGVLVVHNSAGNAKIKNINHGTFTGLVIADDIEKIHTTIIGAAIAMTTTPAGDCIGNGSGQILYSRAALEQASAVAAGETGGGQCGGGQVKVTSWLE